MARADVSQKAVRWLMDLAGEAYDNFRIAQAKSGNAQYHNLLSLSPVKNKTNKSTKQAIMAAVGNSCCYCTTSLVGKEFHMDHIIPANKDHCGLTAWGNLVPACVACNKLKNKKTLQEFLAAKKLVPGTPAYTTVMTRVGIFQQHYAYDQNLANELKQIAMPLYYGIGKIAETMVEQMAMILVGKCF